MVTVAEPVRNYNECAAGMQQTHQLDVSNRLD